MRPTQQPRRLRLATLATMASAALLVGACAGPTVEDGGVAGNETLIIDMGFGITTLDPQQIFDVSASAVVNHMYDQLVTIGPDSPEPVADLAESWEINEDATEFTFTLRDDVVFTDGAPMTSADVVFSFNRLKNYQGSPSYLMDGISVSAPDDHTVVITTDGPKPELLNIITSSNFSVINSEAAKELGATDAEDAAEVDSAGPAFDAQSLGTARYKLASYEPNSEIVLEYNEKFGDEPTFTTLIFRNTTSSQQQLLNVQNGGSHVALDISSPQVAGLADDVAKHMSVPAPQVVYLALTDSSGPTTNDDFRKAISLGIDYDGLVQLGGPGTVQGTGVIPRSLPGALPESEAVKRDVDGAKAALAASGMADEKLVIEYSSDYRVGGLDQSSFAQRIQSSLGEIGMNVVLEPAPTQVSRTRNQEGKAQAAMWPFPPDFAEASQFLIHSPGGILAERTHWKVTSAAEKEIVALAEAAAVETDPEARAAAFQEWNRAMNKQNRFIPLLTNAINLVTAPNITGLNQNIDGWSDFGMLGLAD